MYNSYFNRLYRRAMDHAYGIAFKNIDRSLYKGSSCLDCGANDGSNYNRILSLPNGEDISYHGIEWNSACVKTAQSKGINVRQGDLNRALPFTDNSFDCIIALSVLEHLLNPCFFIKETRRCLKRDGSLVILTPNISTYFTAFLILAGKMPSSGPHPDSEALINSQSMFSGNDKLKLGSNLHSSDIESDSPIHRHLVVFSYVTLKKYLGLAGFKSIEGYGFGLYPFPNFMQPILEKVDPYHCHQMVFIAKK